MSNTEKNNKKSNYKQIAFLILGGILAVGLIYSALSDNNEELPNAVISQPIEVKELNQTQLQAMPNTPNVEIDTAVPESGASIATKQENIDRFFISLSDRSSPPIVTTSTPSTSGVAVKLPELKNPNQLPGLAIVNGGPMPGLMPVTTPRILLRQIVIGGIGCDKGVCQAMTSIGDIKKGDIIGGDGYVVEKVLSINSNGIQTDKRQLIY